MQNQISLLGKQEEMALSQGFRVRISPSSGALKFTSDEKLGMNMYACSVFLFEVNSVKLLTFLPTQRFHVRT
jgi:hypothetical protein